MIQVRTLTALGVGAALLSGSAALAQNLIVNPDFSAGNVGFTSSLTFAAPAPDALVAGGIYTVAPNPLQPDILNGGFAGFFDHTTGDAAGAFLIANGSDVANSAAWAQTITGLAPNADYDLSFWVASLFGESPATFQVQINGANIGPLFTAPTTAGVWTPGGLTWNSGANTSAIIALIDNNTSLPGNDFGLDDFAFSQASAAAPEPGAIALAVTGLGAMGLFARRRRTE